MTDKEKEIEGAGEVSTGQGAAPQEATGNKIIWNDREMQSSYANVSNVATTSDEVMLLFGTSQTWNSAQKDIMVKLTHRIVMTPAAARRFQALLTRSLEEYDKKFGK